MWIKIIHHHIFQTYLGNRNEQSSLEQNYLLHNIYDLDGDVCSTEYKTKLCLWQLCNVTLYYTKKKQFIGI